MQLKRSKSGRISVKRESEVLRIIMLILVFAFSVLPLLSLLFKITGKDLSFVFKDKIFYSALKNSLLYSFISALITLILSVITAYFLNESSLKRKNFFVLILTLGMLVPSLSIGLGMRVFFGSTGILNSLLGISIEGKGFLGLIIGSVSVAFPSCFLIIYDALNYEDKRPYDAAEIMGISRFSTFFKVKLAYLKVPMISAFLASFTLIFSDYGVPMEIAEHVKTLPMYLYEQVISTFNYSRGAIAGLFLLIPAIISFIVEFVFKENSTGENNSQLLKSKKSFNVIAVVLLVLISFILFIPQLSFITISLFKSFSIDRTFTLSHFAEFFTNKQGIGVFRYLLNSLFLSLLVGVFGTVLAYVLGYLSSRKSGKLGKVVNFIAMSTIAIPGIVLGIGYIFLFKNTKGFFYGTMIILVVVNIIHFLGSPYLMAKNFLSKINKDYEVIGETLGVSKFKVILKVLLPSSFSTLVQMFSYFFLNSMITISAVAFLCNYKNKPLSMMISVYETSGNYEMQAVISVVLLIVNIFLKILFNFTAKIFSKKQTKKEGTMELNRFQFDVLTYFERTGKQKCTQRFLSDKFKISVGTVNKTLNELKSVNALQVDVNQEISITEEGLKLLEPYRVRKAIIFAAGFGSRLAPVTLNTPKPLVKVNGVRIIDTLLDALVEKGIKNIVIVRGYKKEQFDELLEKYPFLTFVDNPEFNVTNNISSAMAVVDSIDRCYICEADLFISNSDVINKYEYETNYLGAKVLETDDWCSYKVNGYLANYRQGGEDCYQMYGISYWNEEDSAKLRADIKRVYHSKAGKEHLWEGIPLTLNKKNYKIRIRNCHKEDIVEIDNFYELLQLDESYKDYPNRESF